MILTRSVENPLITPEMVEPSRPGWRVLGAFNAGAVDFNNEILLLLRVAEACDAPAGHVAVPYYRFDGGRPIPETLTVKANDPDLRLGDARAVFYKGKEYVSTLSHIRLARSSDGIHFAVDKHPFISPSDSSECFGVEDARITRIDGTWYINYSAVSGDSYATALASTRDFVDLEHHGLIFSVPNKDVAIFPEKVKGRYCALHRPHNHGFGPDAIWYAESPDLIHWGKHQCIARPVHPRWESQKIGGGAPPIKTPEGWLAVCHGKGLEKGADLYSLFLLLLDLEEPWKVIKRSREPILFPQEDYETKGFVPNVVFSNGLVAKPDGSVLVYYGACDETTCVAHATIESLLENFQ